MKALKHPEAGIPLHDTRLNHQYIRNVFTGENATRWFQQNMEGVDTVDAAMVIGQKFVDWGAMIPLDGDGDFHPLPTSLYKFVETERSGSGSAIRPKTTDRKSVV